MPKITAIKSQKSKKRVNIYLDDKFGFGLDLENFVKLGLRVEQELTEEEIKTIIKKAEYQKTSDKLLMFATLRPRSEKEIKTWFYKKQVPESIQSQLIDKLIKLELLNDEAFAKWWVEQRQSFKPKGKSALKAELISKGINRTIIDKVLSSSDLDEKGQARQLVEKKLYRWQGLPELERKKKISDFLLRKGYSWEVIKGILKDEEK
jgi:regulatory protein